MRGLGRPDRHPHDGRGGFIIVATLWILLALATLSSIAAVYVARSAIALAPLEETLQTDALIAAALELTTFRLSGPPPRPAHGGFRFRLARTEVEVEFLAEGARIDLNFASREVIAGLFAVLGAQSNDAGNYADRVIAWRTAARPGVPDNEAALYLAAGLPYPPRHAPFDHVEELSLVAGLPADLVQQCAPFVTVYGGRGDVNVFVAAPEVIAALPDMTPGRLNAFLAAREAGSPDPRFVLKALGDSPSGITTDAGDAFRVRLRLVSESGRRQTAEVVIQILGPQEWSPYGVLSWKSDSTSGTALLSGRS